MAAHDGTGLPEAAAGVRSTRRRDRLLPAMIERQRLGRIADSARNILAKHHHAIADAGGRLDYDLRVAAARHRSRIDDGNIMRIRSTQ